MRVDWGGVIRIKYTSEREKTPNKDLWTDVMRPKNISDIQGNAEGISSINEWFLHRQCGIGETKSCLFIQGPSGIGKSTIVQLMAREYGVTLVHTYADKQRTPLKLEGVLSEASMIQGGVLVLDDFEAFLRETSSIKFIMKVLKDPSTPLIIVCNEIDASFLPISRASTCVHMDPIGRDGIYRVLSKITSRMKKSCYVPPMDIFIISDSSSGNVCQTINQVQFSYMWTDHPPPFNKRKRKQVANKVKCTHGVTTNSDDSSTKMLFTTYKMTSVEGILREENLLESMENMNRDFLESLGENVYREYVTYFDNKCMKELAECIENISMSDTEHPEFHEDGLYEGENIQRWAEDDSRSIVCIHESLTMLKSREKVGSAPSLPFRRRKRKNAKFSYV